MAQQDGTMTRHNRKSQKRAGLGTRVHSGSDGETVLGILDTV